MNDLTLKVVKIIETVVRMAVSRGLGKKNGELV